MNTTIRLKRAYEPADPADGYRIYIDRLWPRGLSHATFRYDYWDKAIAPSTELREWFHADPADRWPEFRTRYMDQLRAMPEFAQLRKTIAAHPVVTLLYSSHDTARNNAVVVRDLLSESPT